VIGEKVQKILDGTVGRDLVVDHLVAKLRNNGFSLDTVGDRDRSLGTVLQFIRDRKAPRVLETGCMFREDDFNNGFSTYLFGLVLEQVGGHLDSVDISPQGVAFARKWTEIFDDEVVSVHEGNSLDWLASYAGPQFDVIYLDSCDHPEHCRREVQLALPHLKGDGLILIDDTAWVRGKWTCRGALAIPELLAAGFVVAYSGVQTLVVRG
jgi:predicted O-methyltransferase YrrM